MFFPSLPPSGWVRTSGTTPSRVGGTAGTCWWISTRWGTACGFRSVVSCSRAQRSCPGLCPLAVSAAFGECADVSHFLWGVRDHAVSVRVYLWVLKPLLHTPSAVSVSTPHDPKLIWVTAKLQTKGWNMLQDFCLDLQPGEVAVNQSRSADLSWYISLRIADCIMVSDSDFVSTQSEDIEHVWYFELILATRCTFLRLLWSEWL